MSYDVVIRGGTVIDGSGAAGVAADVAIVDDRVVAVGELDSTEIATAAGDASGTRVIDASGCIVTPGFVDIHTHLDAQLAWDPVGSSSCYHGVTSVVLGNCGVTFAPCKPDDREYLATMMESVEDIPAHAIMSGLAWDWETYGEYLGAIDAWPKGINVGGMVGHCAVRVHAMGGERSLAEDPATAEDINRMCELVDEAIGAGALGFSTSRTLLHRVPSGEPVPGTWALPEELLAIGDVMGRWGRGVFESAPRLGERDDRSYTNSRAEIGWMADLSIASGRPVTFGLAHSDRRPDLYRRVMEFVDEGNARGAHVRPQTTARGIGILFGLAHHSPFDGCPTWRAMRGKSLEEKLAILRDTEQREALIAEADEQGPKPEVLAGFYVLGPDEPRYDHDPANSLPAVAAARGLSPAGAFVALCLESEGRVLINFPFLNQDLHAVDEMLADRNVVMGLADAGAHVGQILDASQPTFFLTQWVRERGTFPIEEAVRRLTSDTAGLFGIEDRGSLRVGSRADVNVIDLDALRLHQPTYVHDFPNGAGRYIQRATGYRSTLVNGQVTIDDDQHTGALPGTLLRSGPPAS
jgi:N-acyl-D-aspartate/D-glutamate deacylase